MSLRAVTICVCGMLCASRGAAAQNVSQYRGFTLGSTVATVSALADVQPAEARTIHERPALLQDLEWRPSTWVAGSTTASTDPVDHAVFSFYDDQLFRIVVDYGSQRTRAMTRADLIQAISAVYGAPAPRTALPGRRVASRLEVESGSPVARWGDDQHTIVLYQTAPYDPTFRLLVTDTRLDALAQTADTQALRLDNQEAPRREIERAKKERADELEAAEKARVDNKAGFRP